MEEKKTNQVKTAPAPKKFKVKALKAHQGVTLRPGSAGVVKNGINVEEKGLNIEIELHPAGALVIYKDEKLKGMAKLIPYANIVEADVEFE